MDKNLKIIDDLLSYQDWSNLKTILSGHAFDWYFSDVIYDYELGSSDDDLDNWQFCHCLYKDHFPQSTRYDLLTPFLNNDKIIINSLVKAKINNQPRSHSIIKQGFHVDVDFKCTTGIYYVNSNDGYTEFEDGTKVESKSNRFVTFNSDVRHTGTTCTNKKQRLVININYFNGNED